MGKTGTYRLRMKLSAIFMMCALLWLTVSTPFIFTSQPGFVSQKQWDDCRDKMPSNSEESNPVNNSTEEKKPGGISVSEEYLHTHLLTNDSFLIAAQFHKFTDAAIYIAFHGEMLVPPPNTGC
jgi:hypothetical protein